MKWFILIVFVVMMPMYQINVVYAQTSNKTSKEKNDAADRITKYIPFMNPLPCSVFLGDFGSSKEEIISLAKKIGLAYVETTKDASGEEKVIFDDPYMSIIYIFIFNQDKYTEFFMIFKFNDLHPAIERFDELKDVLYLKWGNDDRDKISATTICKSDNIKKYISIKRDGKSINLYVKAY